MSCITPIRHASRAAASVVARFIRAEYGAAQTISFLMVVPLYLIVFFAIVETCLFLAAKTGTVYAAFAAARTAVVRGEDPRAADRVREAAILAFIPFSSSVSRGPATTPVPGEEEFVTAYRAAASAIGLPGDGVSRLSRQYRIAHRALSVESTATSLGRPWEEDLTVTVTYEFPFTFPIIGRILGRPGVDGRYVYPIHTSATLRMEHPANERREIGIAHARF